MIVCSCNRLTDIDVAEAIRSGACRPGEVYACCGKRPDCGACVRMILSSIKASMQEMAAAAAV
jgi:bacterioferritin-associated ferredoxin